MGRVLRRSAAATPGVVELIDTYAVAATVTAYAVADVQPYSGVSDVPANTSGGRHAAEPRHRAVGHTASAEGWTTTTGWAAWA